MADFKQNYFQRRTKDRGPRSNNRISSPEVQVIASNGENLGILNTNEAISMAKNQGLDLIEIAPNVTPPVCKIMDMGKYKYDAQKKANLAKKKQNIKVTMVHGSKDKSVPVIYSKKVLKIFQSKKKKLVIIKNGDHSLSSPKWLKILKKELKLMIN